MEPNESSNGSMTDSDNEFPDFEANSVKLPKKGLAQNDLGVIQTYGVSWPVYITKVLKYEKKFSIWYFNMKQIQPLKVSKYRVQPFNFLDVYYNQVHKKDGLENALRLANLYKNYSSLLTITPTEFFKLSLDDQWAVLTEYQLADYLKDKSPSKETNSSLKEPNSSPLKETYSSPSKEINWGDEKERQSSAILEDSNQNMEKNETINQSTELEDNQQSMEMEYLQKSEDIKDTPKKSFNIFDVKLDKNNLSEREKRKLKAAKVAREKYNKYVINYMKSKGCVKYLTQIMNGKMSSERHCKFIDRIEIMHDPSQHMKFVAAHTIGDACFGDMSNVMQKENYIEFIWKKLSNAMSFSNDASIKRIYILLVLLPEAIKYFITKKKKNLSESEKERILKYGFFSTPTEKKADKLNAFASASCDE